MERNKKARKEKRQKGKKEMERNKKAGKEKRYKGKNDQ